MLELKGVFVGYGDIRVLNDVSATFETGRVTSVVGINGCGKSTLLKSVVGVVSPNKGEIYVENIPISGMKRKEVATRIAYLAQGRNTPDMTVEQMVLHGRFPYLAYPRRYTIYDREMARRAMEQMGIAHLEEHPLSSLSGGMRQNAYLAMAFAQATQ